MEVMQRRLKLNWRNNATRFIKANVTTIDGKIFNTFKNSHGRVMACVHRMLLQ